MDSQNDNDSGIRRLSDANSDHEKVRILELLMAETRSRIGRLETISQSDRAMFEQLRFADEQQKQNLGAVNQTMTSLINQQAGRPGEIQQVRIEVQRDIDTVHRRMDEIQRTIDQLCTELYGPNKSNGMRSKVLKHDEMLIQLGVWKWMGGLMFAAFITAAVYGLVQFIASLSQLP